MINGVDPLINLPTEDVYRPICGDFGDGLQLGLPQYICMYVCLYIRICIYIYIHCIY